MYDAILIVSFGGPEKAEDVLPFLENVTRGRGTPKERLLEVAEHYFRLGGKSPINDQCRELIAALRAELDQNRPLLPIYWGNRNWHPFLSDTLKQMTSDGVHNALAFITSPYSSYSSCRQYREDIAAAQSELGESAPKVEKLRTFYNHPGFIKAAAERVHDALTRFSAEERDRVRFVVSAHSIPCSMANTSDYELQLRETSRLVAESVGFDEWDLVFQSRSGPHGQPWLGPDVLDYLKHLNSRGTKHVLLGPLGFLSDHVEVLYDLDVEAAQLATELGMKMVRARTVGIHPAFVTMIRQLIEERVCSAKPVAIGYFGPTHDSCRAECCPAPRRAGKSLVLERPVV